MHGFLFTLAKNEANFRLLILYGLLALAAYGAVKSLSFIILPFFFGAIGAYAFNGMVTYLAFKGGPRWLSALAIVFALVFLLVLFVLFAIPVIQSELTVLIQNMPDYVHAVSARINPLLARLNNYLSPQEFAEMKVQLSAHIGNVMLWIVNAFLGIISGGFFIANIISVIVLTPVITFYLLKDWPLVIQLGDQFITHQTVRALLHRIDLNLRAYGRGQALVCAVLAMLYASLLSLVGLNKAIMMGGLIGLLSAIPYLGSFIGLLISLAMALVQFDSWLEPAIIVGIFALITSIEGNVLTPRFIGERIGLHPVVIIFTLLAGVSWFGVLGMLLALPTAAVISAVFVFYREKTAS